jgi:hypothetical protein
MTCACFQYVVLYQNFYQRAEQPAAAHNIVENSTSKKKNQVTMLSRKPQYDTNLIESWRSDDT